MLDRELLVLAARAAKMPVTGLFGATGLRIAFDGCVSGYIWNPLEHDGDALRLAVKLRLHISQQSSYVAVMGRLDGPSSNLVQWDEKYYGDPYAATRRAIVRAAAEVGRTM